LSLAKTLFPTFLNDDRRRLANKSGFVDPLDGDDGSGDAGRGCSVLGSVDDASGRAVLVLEATCPCPGAEELCELRDSRAEEN
jgi:hypothetical protein